MKGNFHVRFGKEGGGEAAETPNTRGGCPLLVHFILEVARPKSQCSGNIAYRPGAVSASFTTFHPHRPVFLTLLNKSHSFRLYAQNAHDANSITAAPLVLLASGSPYIGYSTKDMIIGLGCSASSRGQSSSISSAVDNTAAAEYLPWHLKVTPVIFSHIGIPSAYHTTFSSSPAPRLRQRVFAEQSLLSLGQHHDSVPAQRSFQKN